MRTRPRPRVGEAATVLPLLRYNKISNLVVSEAGAGATLPRLGGGARGAARGGAAAGPGWGGGAAGRAVVRAGRRKSGLSPRVPPR